MASPKEVFDDALNATKREDSSDDEDVVDEEVEYEVEKDGKLKIQDEEFEDEDIAVEDEEDDDEDDEEAGDVKKRERDVSSSGSTAKWEMDPKWGSKGRRCVRPLFTAARRYGKFRDTVLDKVCHPWLTAPLLGPLSYRWWAIDINILELIFFGAVFGVLNSGATAGGNGSNFGIATGIITMLVVATIPRNNFIRFVLGVPFERMVKYHRWCGYYLAVPLFLHALLYRDFFGDYTRITGTIAWIAFMVIIVTSVIIFRRHYFEFFYFVHFAFAVYIGAAIAHEIVNLGFVIPGLIMYAIDILFRFLRYWTTSRKTLSVTQLEEDMTVLRLTKKFNYKPGQYAFVLIPSISRLQWHPYSISSAPQESTLTFHVNDNGGWSHAVTRLPESKQVTVKIDGPYGKVGVRYRKYRTVAMFTAGAGVTPMMSVLKDIYFRRQMGLKKCKVEKIYFYWTIGRIGCLDWFIDDIRKLQANPILDLEIEFNIHVTRTPKRLLRLLEESDPVGVPIKRGRPHMIEEFNRMKEDLVSANAAPADTEVGAKKPKKKRSAVAVLACGPRAYAYAVRKQCLKSTGLKARFDYHSETFEF